MNTDCAAVRDLVAELALDVAPAAERASAFAHAEECPPCSALLSRAATVADLLLLAVPARTPPGSARQRMFAALPQERHSAGATARSRRHRPAAAAAAVTLIGGSLAGVVLAHRPAAAPQSLTAALDDGVGRPVGRAVLTGGAVPAVHLSFTVPPGVAGSFQVRAVGGRGASVTVGTAHVAAGVCTFSHVLALNIATVRTIEVRDADQPEVYRASFG